jgi:hypothetical protein
MPLLVFSLILLLAVIVGFLQPVFEIGIQVFSFLNAQKVNDSGIFLLGFLDAAMLQASAQGARFTLRRLNQVAEELAAGFP